MKFTDATAYPLAILLLATAVSAQVRPMPPSRPQLAVYTGKPVPPQSHQMLQKPMQRPMQQQMQQPMQQQMQQPMQQQMQQPMHQQMPMQQIQPLQQEYMTHHMMQQHDEIQQMQHVQQSVQPLINSKPVRVELDVKPATFQGMVIPTPKYPTAERHQYKLQIQKEVSHPIY